ncbi:MAG: hypothetical protein ABR569_10250 [Gaiellaceae bacterium]
MSTEANYLRDLGYLLREAALEAKSAAEAAPAPDRAFQLGRLMAYHEVISLMQQQAHAFELPLARVALEGIDPERDLL